MSRTARLMELMIRVQTRPRFTAAELAEEFGVSRRTMQRDLSALSEMGIPLHTTPGPGGGYSLPRGGRRLSPSLTVSEALALIVSYEALLRYPVQPFSSEGISAVTKLRSALPRDILTELERLREYVTVLEPVRDYEAPFLGELLEGSLDGAHLKVIYDSVRSGISERTIFPFGVYASQGFWYCACRDYKNEMNVSLRADRFLSVERLEEPDVPPRPFCVSLKDWTREVRGDTTKKLRLRVFVNAQAAKNFELVSLLGRVGVEPDGRALVETEIYASEIDYYASRLMSIGAGVRVESPPELAESIRDKAYEITRLYD